MMRCKDCGTVYTATLGVCPKCSTDEMLKHPEYQTDIEPLSPEAQARHKKRRWIGLILGIPGLIAFIYVILYLLKQWQALIAAQG